MTLHPLILRLAGAPALLMPGAEAQVMALQEVPITAGGAAPDGAALIGGTDGGTRPYDLVDGVAVIPVDGVLMPVDWSLRGWVTGYPVLRWQIGAALADEAVTAIALVLDSPGGAVCGCEELGTWLYGQRGAKPVVAIVDSMAASAAYWLASAADMVVMPRTGIVGSIGVVALHLDMSKMLADWGIQPTLIHHGERKVDGNQYEPLSDGAREAWQAHVDRIGTLFAQEVARNRSLDIGAVTGLQAGVFDGVGDAASGAVRAGLVDEVMPADQALEELIAAVAPAA